MSKRLEQRVIELENELDTWSQTIKVCLEVLSNRIFELEGRVEKLEKGIND